MVVFAVATLANRALGNKKSGTTTAECAETGTEYVVHIQDSQPTITDINTKLCDKLTIVNDDNQLRLIAFGVHENHKAYNGVTEHTLEQGEQFSVTLNQTGGFTFHDHLHDTFLGKFTVQ